MVLVLFLVFFLFGCSLERNNPYDPHGINYDPSLYSSSSSLPGGLVPCSHAAGCAEISAEACFAFGGQLVASCSASSSSHLLAEVSSSGEAGSSSSIPEVMVLCRLSDGTCPLTLISQEACVMFGGTPVQSCAVSSSSAVPSSSSTEPSSSSSAPPSSSSIAPSSSSAVPSSSSLVPSSSSLAPSSSSLSHIGKGNNISNYRTVAIGTQTWMAENLDYVVEGSKCYNNDPARCNEYGSLYNWATAMNLPSSCNSNSCSSQIQSPHRGICPSGWHIPSDAEWTTLTDYVGSSAGTKLKAKSGWNDYQGASGNGTDEYGFSALPGGDGDSSGSFSNVGINGDWWSATEYNADSAYSRHMYYSYSNVNRYSNYKSYLYSVRCLQD